MVESLRLGVGASPVDLPLSRLNRHALVTGATGTGKTVSLLGIAARLAACGVPSFFPDIKGDVSALARSAPVRRLEPFRLAAHDVDPATFARVLGLSPVQGATLEMAWARFPKITTLDDVRSALVALRGEPGVSSTSLAVILRSLLAFERLGGSGLIGAPSFDVASLIDLATDGQGLVNVLPAERLAQAGAPYALALLHVLDSLYERSPEVGDLDKPRAVLIFDESHLLFADATPEAVAGIARKVRLIRSKGYGLVFASQAPSDLPAEVLSQLGTRIQHGLRAASPVDLRRLKVAAESMPVGADRDPVTTIRNLPTGSALVSVVRLDGSPSPSVVVRMIPPPGSLAPLTVDEVAAVPTFPGETSKSEPGRPVDQPTGDFFVGLAALAAFLGVLSLAIRHAIG